MNEEHIHIVKLRSGNTNSFEYLYYRWSGKLYNFIMRISHEDFYLAEEIVQSVFIKVWEHRNEINPEQSFGNYICTIAKNMLANMYQRRMQELLYGENIGHPSPNENSTEKEVDYKLLEEFIDQLIERLPPARKEIFILSRREFLSNREIAEKLDISESTVESQMNKALRFLREKIQNHYRMTISLLFYFLNSQ